MENYFKLDFNNTSYLVNSLLPKAQEQAYYEDYFDLAKITSQSKVETRGGRGQTILFAKDNLNLILRSYKRGGLFGKLVKDKFFKFESHPHRAFDEFRLLLKLKALNLPVPTPIIARQATNLISVKQQIVIERLVGFNDLSYVLSNRNLSEEEYIQIGKCIKKFFEAGVLHTDLNIRNILINDKLEVYVIDFDKCFLLEKLSDNKKQSMLDRLKRSFNKELLKKLDCQSEFNEEYFNKLCNEALKSN